MDEIYYNDGHNSVAQQPPSSSDGSSAPSNPPRDQSTTVEGKRETRRRTKTGCLTCRKRRIKCDEGKPECLRCLKSKRTCEGYSVKTVFRNENLLHYQQNIRPSTAPDTGFAPIANSIQFSLPQYIHHDPETARNRQNSFGQAQYNATNNFVPMPNIPQSGKNIISASRNSSASNGSGVSADSQQRRISVLSLMSSEKNGDPVSGGEPNHLQATVQFQENMRTAETDIRDNFYYNYYVSCHAFTLARNSSSDVSAKGSARDDPQVLWPQTVPSLINEDPPGRRPLFDAVVSYTAHVRFEEIPIDFRPRSKGQLARVVELGLKSYIDIMRGTAETLGYAQSFFAVDDSLHTIFRWGILQHTIISILADAKPRVSWINFLGTKAFGTKIFTPTSEIESFYVGALRHISSNNSQIPQSLLSLQNRYDFLSVPGMDIIYFAFIQDYDALRNIAFHVLSNPRLEYLYLVYQMINGGRLKGEPELDHLANELMMAVRQSN